MNEEFVRRRDKLYDEAMKALSIEMMGEYIRLVRSEVKSKTLQEAYVLQVKDPSTTQLIRVGLPQKGDGVAKLAWLAEVGKPEYN